VALSNHIDEISQFWKDGWERRRKSISQRCIDSVFARMVKRTDVKQFGAKKHLRPTVVCLESRYDPTGYPLAHLSDR